MLTSDCKYSDQSKHILETIAANDSFKDAFVLLYWQSTFAEKFALIWIISHGPCPSSWAPLFLRITAWLAVALHNRGFDALVLKAADHVGGQVKTQEDSCRRRDSSQVSARRMQQVCCSHGLAAAKEEQARSNQEDCGRAWKTSTGTWYWTVESNGGAHAPTFWPRPSLQ